MRRLVARFLIVVLLATAFAGGADGPLHAAMHHAGDAAVALAHGGHASPAGEAHPECVDPGCRDPHHRHSAHPCAHGVHCCGSAALAASTSGLRWLKGTLPRLDLGAERPYGQLTYPLLRPPRTTA